MGFKKERQKKKGRKKDEWKDSAKVDCSFVVRKVSRKKSIAPSYGSNGIYACKAKLGHSNLSRPFEPFFPFSFSRLSASSSLRNEFAYLFRKMQTAQVCRHFLIRKRNYTFLRTRKLRAGAAGRRKAHRAIYDFNLLRASQRIRDIRACWSAGILRVKSKWPESHLKNSDQDSNTLHSENHNIVAGSKRWRGNSRIPLPMNVHWTIPSQKFSNWIKCCSICSQMSIFFIAFKD